MLLVPRSSKDSPEEIENGSRPSSNVSELEGGPSVHVVRSLR